MKLMKYCISPSKLAWLRKEFGKDANGLIAAMDAAGTAYLDKLNAVIEPQVEDMAAADVESICKTKTQQRTQRQWAYLWLQQRVALATRTDEAELAALTAFELQPLHIEVVQPSELYSVLA